MINYKYKNRIYYILPYIIMFMVMLLLHKNMSLRLSDDAHFAQILQNQSLSEHIKNLYFNINGKIIPDSMAAIFTYFRPAIFKILNSLIFTAIPFLIVRTFGDVKKVKHHLFACLLILMFPLEFLNSAGYVATSTNYLWSSFSLLIVFSVVSQVLRQKKLHWYDYCLAIIGTIYAGNQEQSCAILLCACIIIALYKLFLDKKIPFIFILIIALSFISLIFVMSAPGHSARANDYSIFSIPDFYMYTFLDKVQLGLTSTFAYFITRKNILLSVFLFLLAYQVSKSEQKIITKMISWIPFVIVFLFSWIPNLTFSLVPSLKDVMIFSPSWGYGLPDFLYIDAETFLDFKTYIPTIIIFVFILSIIHSFWFLIKDKKELLLYFLIASAGLCSRMIMAFTPKLYGSSYRTYIYMLIAIIFIVFLLCSRMNEKGSRRLFIFLIPCACMNIIHFLVVAL